MNLLIISPVFPPEPIISARTSWLLADEMGKADNIVRVVTSFPSRPGGKLYEGYHKKLWEYSQNGDKLFITRTFSIFSNKSEIFNRLLENISFGISSSIALLFSKRPDVVYINTWPIFAQGLNAMFCRIKHIKFVLSIQDVYPESLLSQKRFSESSLIIRVLRWLDAKIAKSAAAVIGISDHFKAIYIQERGIDEGKVFVVPNFIQDHFVPGWNDIHVRDLADIKLNSFVFLYAGNIGVAAGVETIVKYFKKFQGDAVLLIAGGGSQLAFCVKEAAEVGNVKFWSPWESDDTNKVLASGDVFLLPTVNDQSLASVPSKLITYMLAGKPVLALVHPDSEVARVITQAACGWVIPPVNEPIFLESISKIRSLPKSQLAELGKNGRNYALKHFTSDVCVPQVINIIEEVAAKHD
ncbi:MAG: glycosyltransferase family 4 protein [Anaerolineae bacterium]|nr:glycosyltransferase family 4 protein [Anaerolineae bacterium]